MLGAFYKKAINMTIYIDVPGRRILPLPPENYRNDKLGKFSIPVEQKKGIGKPIGNKAIEFVCFKINLSSPL